MSKAETYKITSISSYSSVNVITSVRKWRIVVTFLLINASSSSMMIATRHLGKRNVKQLCGKVKRITFKLRIGRRREWSWALDDSKEVIDMLSVFSVIMGLCRNSFFFFPQKLLNRFFITVKSTQISIKYASNRLQLLTCRWNF